MLKKLLLICLTAICCIGINAQTQQIEKVELTTTGNVTQHNNEDAVLKQFLESQGIAYSPDITVSPQVLAQISKARKPAATGITLTPSAVSLFVDETYQLQVTPADATGIEWITGNPAVVTVENGLLTGVNEGSTVVVAMHAASGSSPVCIVTVSKRYTLTLKAEAPDWGTVTGGGDYKKGETVTITATPKEHYRFVKWKEDGDTEPTRKITIEKSMTLTAVFEPIMWTITTESNNDAWGTTKGDGTFQEGTTIPIEAKPTTHYEFVKWDDGDTNAEREVTVTGDKTYIAEFAPKGYSIVVKPNNNLYGTTTGTGTYPYGSNQTITATANEHYEFVDWNDGIKAPEREIIIAGATTYTANFKPKDYQITVTSKSNPAWGTVSGSGMYPYGSEQPIKADPAEHYMFVGWNDGNKAAERTITVLGPQTYTAEFAPIKYEIITNSSNEAHGTATGGGLYEAGKKIIIEAQAKEHYKFVKWSDGNTLSPREVTVTGDSTFTAIFEAIMCTITTKANNDTYGKTSGGGSFQEGSDITITATPNNGYEFVKWEDGNTEINRLITVSRDATYTAIFQPKEYTITVKSANDPAWGTVGGSGKYPYGSKQKITATAAPNYKFVGWHDGNKDANRTITITEDQTYTAEFAPLMCTITTKSDNDAYGTASGGQTVQAGTTITITATAKEHYQFVKWHDGNKEANRTITVTKDETYTAIFAPKQYTITAKTDSTKFGSVTGSGQYDYNTPATLTATPNEHYEFVEWSDGDKNPTRTVTVTGDATYIAIFTPKDYTIIVTSGSDATWGTVSGSGTYKYGSQPIITATAAPNYEFVSWNDGNTDANRTITVEDDKTYTATFAPKKYTITAKANDATFGSVTGSGQYDYNTEAILTATPNEHYEFVEWSDGDKNPTRNVTVTGDATYTAIFKAKQYIITVIANNPAYGNVTGSGTYDAESTIIITATPNEGYKFTQWLDGDINPEREVKVLGTANYIAIFEKDITDGLDNTTIKANKVRKVLHNGTIHIIKPNGEMYTIDGTRIQ